MERRWTPLSNSTLAETKWTQPYFAILFSARFRDSVEITDCFRRALGPKTGTNDKLFSTSLTLSRGRKIERMLASEKAKMEQTWKREEGRFLEEEAERTRWTTILVHRHLQPLPNRVSSPAPQPCQKTLLHLLSEITMSWWSLMMLHHKNLLQTSSLTVQITGIVNLVTFKQFSFIKPAKISPRKGLSGEWRKDNDKRLKLNLFQYRTYRKGCCDDRGIWEKAHQAYHKCFLSRDISRLKLSGAAGWRKGHPWSLKTCPLAGCHDVPFISVFHILLQHIPNAEKTMDRHRHNLPAGTILFDSIRVPVVHHLKVKNIAQSSLWVSATVLRDKRW